MITVLIFAPAVFYAQTIPLGALNPYPAAQCRATML